MTDFTSEKDSEFIQQHCIDTGTEYIPGMSIDVYWNDYHGDESPRDWHHNSTFITWEVDGDSPDKNPYDDYEDFLVNNGVPHVALNATDCTITTYLQYLNKTLVCLPVYKYKHGDIQYSTEPFGCYFDSGFVGFIYVSKEDICKEHKTKQVGSALRKQIEEELTEEIQLYSAWAENASIEITDEAPDFSKFSTDDIHNLYCQYQKLYVKNQQIVKYLKNIPLESKEED